MKRRAPYLRRNRLEDVLFLIQHLGLESYSLQQGTTPDGIAPRSVRSKQWVEVAIEHPEFFRVTDKGSITLALRYHLRADMENTPHLSLETIQQLIKTALALHERQARANDLWKSWGTMLAALVAAIASLAQLFLH